MNGLQISKIMKAVNILRLVETNMQVRSDVMAAINLLVDVCTDADVYVENTYYEIPDHFYCVLPDAIMCAAVPSKRLPCTKKRGKKRQKH